MNDINSLHREAMSIAEAAIMERFKGDPIKAKEFFEKAFKLEKEAALLTRDNSAEPSRSVLFRSAASLAINFGDYREAEKMINLALAGDPPDEIADELRDLYEQVNFQRHLDLQGIFLEANEMQLAISGPGIGFGIARSEEFIKRIDIIEKLAYRTVERKMGLPFREQGASSKGIKERFEPYISVPRAASFAVTIRLGRPKNQKLLFPDENEPANIINELMDDIELINNQEESKLREKIKDKSYFRNFVSLTKKLAPDGKNVNLVGLTATRDGKEKKVALTRIRKEIKSEELQEKEHEKKKKPVEVTGTLSYADADQKKIKLTDEKGKRYMVNVPEGLLSDIVKPYWEDVVVVSGYQIDNNIYLEDIERA